MENLDHFLEIAHKLADTARPVVHQYYRTPVAVDVKADASPVTIADREVETAMRAILIAELPDHGILGEEHGHHNIDADFVWVLDPIDCCRYVTMAKQCSQAEPGFCFARANQFKIHGNRKGMTEVMKAVQGFRSV